MANDWPTVQLGELAADELGAIAIGPFGSRMKAEVYLPEGIPVIRGTNISNSRSLEGDWVYVSHDVAASMPNCLLKPGDLTFPHRGAIGRVAIIRPEHGVMMMSTSMMKFRPDSTKADSGYLFYYFRSHAGRSEILKFTSQVGTPGIGQPLTSLRQFQVILPPIEVQKLITAFLGSLDDKIELNRRINRTLEKMATAIFKSWFIDFDPVRAKAEGRDPNLPAEIADLFPDSFEDSALGPIPKGWACSTVGKEFNLTMGQSPPGETYNESCEGLPFFQGRRDFGFRYPTNRVYCTAPTRYAIRGDTLISVRAPVGDVNMAIDQCSIGRGVAAARHKSTSISYTYYACRSLQDRFEVYNGEGTVFGSVSQREFRAIPWLAPDNEVISSFDQMVGPIDHRIEVNEVQNRRLASLRNTLLPKLLSGDIRIPAARETGEDAA